MEWQEYFKEEDNLPTADRYYLAQIAAEVARGHVKAPERVKVKDFLLEFEPEKQETPESQEQLLARKKQAWFALVGTKTKTPPSQVKHGNDSNRT